MKRFFLILQCLFFCVFFSIGAGAIVLSILIDPELSIYYRNRQYLDQTRRENEILAALTEQTQAQIDLISREPNVLGRLEPLTFGREPVVDEQTTVPAAGSRELMQAAHVILEEMRQPPPPSPVPAWLQRCSQLKFRKALFASGAGLILVSFVFFGGSRPVEEAPPTRKRRFLDSHSGAHR